MNSLDQTQKKKHTIITDMDLKNPNIKLFYGLIYLFVFCFGLLQFVPFLWMCSGSLQSVQEVHQTPPVLIPKEFKWTNYIRVWQIFDFIKYILNSLVLSGIVVLLQITLVPLCAYSLAKLTPPFSQIIFLCFLSTMMVPSELIMTPLYLIMKAFPFANIPFTNIKLPHFNFIDTYWPLILPFSAAGNLFLYKSFFTDLPDDLINAARIDGCSEFHIFRILIIPLSKPVLAVVSIFTFMYSWGSYMGPLIYLQTKAKYPLILAIATEVSGLISSTGGESLYHNEFMAISIIAMIPMIVFFIFAQRYIIKGISLTGIKW